MNNRSEVVEKLNQFDPLSKKLLILINRLCIEQGIKVRSFFTVIEPFFSDPPYQIQATIDGLSLGYWIEVFGDEIKAIKEYEKIISEIAIENDPLQGIIARLVEFTAITPHDNLLDKIPYIRMGFAVLKYYHTKDRLGFGEDADLYGRLAVNVSKAVGVTKGIGGCRQLYDLPIYKILEYSQTHVKYGSTTYAQICLSLSSLHNCVFEYEGCQRFIEQARIVAIREGFTDTQVKVYIAKSDMLLNQSLFGESLFYLKLGYDLNIMLHGEECVENVEVILKICNICLILHDKDTCRKWLSKLPCDLSRFSELYILKTLIEAELFDEIEFGLQTFEEAEFISWRLFGYTQPYIYNARSRYYDLNALYEEGNSEYGKYMRMIRAKFGSTTNGDLCVYISSKVLTSLANGAYQTAAQLNRYAIDLCPADGPQFSFGARTYQYLAISSTYCYATHENTLACAYSTAVIEQIYKYVKISTEIVNKVGEIFGSEDEIPASTFCLDQIRLAYTIKIDVAISEGQFENGRSLCIECLNMLHDSIEECFILSKLGYVYAKMGEIDNAVSSWKKAIETSGNNALEIAAESAWGAYDSGYTDLALDIINNVSTKHSKNSVSYSSFLTIADICSTAGLEEKKQSFYAAAREISRSRIQHCRCLYYEALELQDWEAINRLEKAVDCEADPGLCVDEELSRRWMALAENKDAIGLRSEAKSAALKAVKFYPGENPYEEIEELL